MKLSRKDKRAVSNAYDMVISYLTELYDGDTPFEIFKALAAKLNEEQTCHIPRPAQPARSLNMPYNIIMLTNEYSPTKSGKGFKKKPDTTEKKRITPEYYRNITEPKSLQFFRRLGGTERAERTYTPMGYVITRLLSTSPGKRYRIERIFTITHTARPQT